MALISDKVYLPKLSLDIRQILEFEVADLIEHTLLRRPCRSDF